MSEVDTLLQLPKRAIDLNRGVRIRVHKPTGMRIYMYKDDPGVYYNAHGKTVPIVLAAECGFPVDELSKLKKRKLAMKEAADAIDREMALSNVYKRDVVLKEAGDYKLIDGKLGRAIIKDNDGNLITALPIAMEAAEALFAKLTAPEPPEEPAPKPDLKKLGVRSMG